MKKEETYKLTLRRERCATVSGLIEGTGKIRTAEELLPLIHTLTKDEPQEVMLAFYFKGGSILIGYSEIARGGLDSVHLDSRVIFATALLCGATSVTLAHNHPSGNPRPSRQDVRLMKKLIPASDAMNIFINDHVIVGDGDYVSMQEFGLMPNRREVIKDDEKERERELDAAAEKTK